MRSALIALLACAHDPPPPPAASAPLAQPQPQPQPQSFGGESYGGLIGNQPPAPVPVVRIGQPQANGNLDKAIIRRYIKRNIQKIQYCYEKQLAAKPALQGTVATHFTIEATGFVSNSTASGVDPDVANCVAAVIATIQFPKPQGGGTVVVNYPFVFAPASP